MSTIVANDKDLRAKALADYSYGDDDTEMGNNHPYNWNKSPVAGLQGGGGSGGVKASRNRVKELVETVCFNVNYGLLVSKTFYFFFFGAFGSLFPLIAVYFKQLGMSPGQTGLLVGFRPFVEYLSAPFWGGLATKWKKTRMLLLFSLFCWVAFTLGLAFIQPPVAACLALDGNRTVIVEKDYHTRNRRSVGWGERGGVRRNGGSLSRGNLHTDVEEGQPPSGDLSRVHKGQSPNDGYYNPEGLGGVLYEEQIPKRRYSVSVPSNPLNTIGNEQPQTISRSYFESSDSETRIRKRDKGAPQENKPPPANKEAPVKEPPKPLTTAKTKHTQLKTITHRKDHVYGRSPLQLNEKDIANLNEWETGGLVSPPMSDAVYKASDVYSIFLVLLIMMIIGEFLSAPAIALADMATIAYLEDNMESYGRQRMFGSIGWGLAMFFVGIALDHSDVFPNHPCGDAKLIDRNYTVNYAVFCVLMSCAFMAATQFKFDSKTLGEKDGDIIAMSQMKNGPQQQQRGDFGDKNAIPAEKRLEINVQSPEGVVSPPRDAVGDTVGKTSVPDLINRPSPYVPRGEIGQPGTMPEWLTVLKHLANVQCIVILFLLWYFGFGVGLIFTFLFWHLQDMHGTPMLFGIASVVAHFSEVLMYFLSKRLIFAVGHLRILYIFLVVNIARFFYISWISNPWWVLPFEFLHGVSHAAVWAACCSYIAQVTPVQNRGTSQVILQGIHHGLGRGCGTVIGGALVSAFGTEYTFRGYAITCIFFLIGYAILDFFYIRKHMPNLVSQEPRSVVEETAHLAPYGVPMTISRNLSSQNLEAIDHANAPYGSTNDAPIFTAVSKAARGTDYGYDRNDLR